jgi:hypothetical protein
MGTPRVRAAPGSACGASCTPRPKPIVTRGRLTPLQSPGYKIDRGVIGPETSKIQTPNRNRVKKTATRTREPQG